MPATDPHIENEIKIRYSGTPAEARALIESRGYRLIEPRRLESDQVFDRAGELRDSGQLLRLRRAGDTALVTYKGPVRAGHHKNREEIEFDVSNPENFAMVLQRLGYQLAFAYEKYRSIFAAADEPGIVTIDETPIGVFLEIEGPPAWVDQTAARLGFVPAGYLTASYATLYKEFRLSHPDAPANMVFG